MIAAPLFHLSIRVKAAGLLIVQNKNVDGVVDFVERLVKRDLALDLLPPSLQAALSELNPKAAGSAVPTVGGN